METDKLIHEKEELSRVQKLLKNRKLIIEPVACILFFSVFLSAQVITNHITYRVCRSELNEDEEICRKLERKEDGLNSKDLETQVQPFVASFNSYKVIIEALLPALMSLFVGAWSDKHGRKRVILFAYSGFVMQFLIFYLLGSISTPIKAGWYLLASLPVAITGGNCILVATLMSYITDISSEESRSKRVANFQVSLILGIFLGSAFSGLFNKSLGAVNIFLVSTLVLLTGIVYIITRLPESIDVSKNTHSGLSDLFRTDMIMDMANSAFRPRKSHDRVIVWLIIVNFAITMFQNEGTNVLFFLYAREKFGWTLEDFSIFVIIVTICMILGTQLGVRIKDKLKLSDTKAAVFGVTTLLLSAIVNAKASVTWHLYAGMLIGLFRGLPDIMNRSILASVVGSNEMGKINSLIGSIQAMCSLGGAPLYTWIYKQTIGTNPGAFLYLNALLFGVTVCSFGVIHFLKQNVEDGKSTTSKKQK